MPKSVLCLCAGLLLCVSGFAAELNLLKNAEFTELDAKGVPKNWRCSAGDVLSLRPAELPTGTIPSVQVRIGTVVGSLGELGQRVAVQPGWDYRVQANLNSETPGLALLQVKLFRQGRELKRFDVGGKSGKGWTPVRGTFVVPADADAAEVLCRYSRNESSQGKWVQFAAVSLVALGEHTAAATRLSEVTAVPTFEAIGVSAGYEGEPSSAARCVLRYRIKGQAAWQNGLELVRRPTERLFRGSILGARPATDYEIECDLLEPGQPSPATPVSARATTRTWSDELPIAKTVRLPAGVTKQPLIISDQGTETGWILYTSAADGSSVIDAGASAPAAVQLKDAAYVVFENVTVRGGAARGVHVLNSHHIRIRHCDVSGWGDPGTAQDGLKSGRYVDAGGKLINWQAGVHVGSRSSQVVVEGNFIHAARGTANSWAYGHPAGPQAVILEMTAGNNVVRDNDLIGDEQHWWNDAIESMYNEKPEGGPHRDTDISGNVMAFANDDGTELDGGQINVRFFNNWVQWTYCGVSCAPNRAGPSYVFRNLFVMTGEQRGRTNFGFKMGGDRFADPGRSFLLHNTMVSTNAGLSTGHYGHGSTPITARNNAYLSGEVFLRGTVEGNYDLDYDLIQPGTLSPPDAGQKNAVLGVPTFVSSASGDYRLAAGSKGIDAALRLPGVNDEHAGAGPDMGAFEHTQSAAVFPSRRAGMSALPLLVRLQGPAGGESSQAEIELIVPRGLGTRWVAHPNADWIRVEPAAGACGDRPQRILVAAATTPLAAGQYRGAVTFRTDSGYCRTVLLERQIRHAKPFVIAIEAEDGELAGGFAKVTDKTASGGAYLQTPAGYRSEAGGGVAVSFDIPADGVYYVTARTRIPGPVAMTHDSLFVAMDDQPREQWNLQYLGSPDFNWVALPFKEQVAKGFKLTQGRHTLHFYPRETLASLDAVRISNEPFVELFPPQGRR